MDFDDNMRYEIVARLTLLISIINEDNKIKEYISVLDKDNKKNVGMDSDKYLSILGDIIKEFSNFGLGKEAYDAIIDCTKRKDISLNDIEGIVESAVEKITGTKSDISESMNTSDIIQIRRSLESLDHSISRYVKLQFNLATKNKNI